MTKATSFNINRALRGRIVIAVFCVLAMTADAASQSGPEEMFLTGVVRDFHERTAPGGHPDFERQPDNGFGHYSGMVELYLGEDGNPVSTGDGFKVNSQWRNSDGCPVAPHLYNSYFSSSGGPVESCVTLRDSQGVDAFEVCLVSAVFNADGTSSWTYHVRELPTGKDLSHWNLALDPSHGVVAGTTPGYDLGTDGSTGFYGIKWDVSDSFSEGDFTIVLDDQYAGAVYADSILRQRRQRRGHRRYLRANDCRLRRLSVRRRSVTRPGQFPG